MVELVKVPNDKLRVRTRLVKKVTPQLRSIFREMESLTRQFSDPEGVGLASTQVGKEQSYFVVKMKDGKFRAFVNPRIIKYSKRSKEYFEGCLSIPDTYGEVNRAYWVDVEYLDELGVRQKDRFSGLEAWIIQHEYDHLLGVLFVDRVLEQKSKLYQVAGKDLAGSEIFQEIKI